MVEIGQKVRVLYTGTSSDGSVFDTNRSGGEPLEFVVGNRTLLPAFEKAVLDMDPGDVVTIHIPAAEAYGERDEKLVVNMPSANLPHSDGLEAGGFIMLGTQAGTLQAKVLEVTPEHVRIDVNHPLAGQDLVFEIELLEVVRQSAIERELHGDGCACGCQRLKASLEAQGAC